MSRMSRNRIALLAAPVAAALLYGGALTGRADAQARTRPDAAFQVREVAPPDEVPMDEVPMDEVPLDETSEEVPGDEALMDESAPMDEAPMDEVPMTQDSPLDRPLTRPVETRPAGPVERLTARRQQREWQERQRRQVADRANEEDWFRDGGRGDGRDEGFPSAEVHDAVVAHGRAAAARAFYRRAESDLNRVVRGARSRFENSPELRQARAAEQQAYDAYLAARNDALKDVLSNARYQAIQTLRGDLTRQIAERRRQQADQNYQSQARAAVLNTEADPAYLANLALEQHAGGPAALTAAAPSGNEVQSLAMFKLQIAQDAREMERAATRDNEALQQALAELKTAAARVSELRARSQEELRNSPELHAARENMADARMARAAAQAYLRASRQAAEEAVDFAYYQNRFRRSYLSDYGYGYGYSGYGYGGSPRYGIRFPYLRVGY